jgi:ATP-binding cassette subfamily F protein 3
MIVVTLDNVTYSYGYDPVFTKISWPIHDDRVVGLIGPNGCGKSTLMRLILGEIKQDAGFINAQPGVEVGYLPQEIHLDESLSVWEAVYQSNARIFEINRELNRIESKLSEPETYNDEKRLARALSAQERLLDEFSECGGNNYDGWVKTTLTCLGFSETDFGLSVAVLSGGQKKLVGLARLLVNKPNVLLLDEPDNHLDLRGKSILEKFIREFQGAVVIVSHDRYLLDLVVDEIAELDYGQMVLFKGNYSEYVFEKGLRLERQQQLFTTQQKEINRLEQSAKRLMMWGRVYDNGKFISRAQNILKRIERIDKIEKPVLEPQKMKLQISGWTGSQKVLEVSELEKYFIDESIDEMKIVLDGVNFLISHGQRVGIVGPNGAGKSLLFRIILEEIAPSAGEVYLGPSILPGYYAQHHEVLDMNKTLIDTVREAGSMSEEKAVAFLKHFLFPYKRTRDKVGHLSGGERSRLQMALLMLSGTNFLMLDEPTNHLDIASAEVLEEAIADFEGTVLVISHDRYFLDRVVDHIIELDQGKVKTYLGGYSDYQEEKTNRR